MPTLSRHETNSQTPQPFLRRVRIKNCKSIGQCDITLFPLTFLVGRNGAGKSNFLDALRFVSDSLQTTLDHAIKTRGGLDAVRRRSTGHPRNFAIKLELTLPSLWQVSYGFEIAAKGRGGFVVKHEELRLRAPDNRTASYFLRRDNVLDSSLTNPPEPVHDRLYLVVASGFQEFKESFEALASMGFYNLNPEAIKELQSPDAGDLLARDGSNIASVIARLEQEESHAFDRIKQFLKVIVPGITSVRRVSLGPRETLEFRQRVTGAKHPWRIFAQYMSDGTLRALGSLIAISQLLATNRYAGLVGIEEPETALHPAASAALMDALREATPHTQVIVTSHSPDLLDAIDVDSGSEGLFVVVSEDGKTSLAPADEASRQAIAEHLYSPGDLLRMDQLEIDEFDIERQEQMQLFGSSEALH